MTTRQKWITPAEIDTSRNIKARVRLHDGREMKAIWTENDRGARFWICSDDRVRGLYDVVAVLIEDTLPFPRVPGATLSDAELLADVADDTGFLTPTPAPATPPAARDSAPGHRRSRGSRGP